MQAPLPSHWSFWVWLLPSSHDVPSGSEASLGHSAESPRQKSGTSQSPASALHKVVSGS